MDDLDRLYYEFVEIVRRERPAALKSPLTIIEVYDQLIPYRRIRNAVGFLSNDEYEVALSRLLAGERGYLGGDPVVQQELASGLEESLPDIRRYLAFSDARVWLDPDRIPPPGHIRYAPPEVREQTDWAEALAPSSDAEPTPNGGEETPGAGEGGFEAVAEVEELDGRCPECRAVPPDGAAFCPFCGARLAPDTCRRCGAALDAGWSFCAECGEARDRRGGPPPDAS